MNNEDEEKMLADKLADARHQLECAERALRDAKFKRHNIKSYYEEIKQACADYMLGNGIVECDAFVMRKTYVVDIEDDALVPEEYQRTKVTVTPNKQKIRDERPMGNWYVMRENYNLVEK